LLEKIIKFMKTPIQPGKPQTSPILILAFVTILLLINIPQWPEAIPFWKKLMYGYVFAAFMIAMVCIVEWYKNNRNM